MTQKKESDIRREEILDAAEDLFARRGYDHTSTNDILSQTGIARGTLYYYFKSKEEILDGVLDRITAKCVAQTEKIVSDPEIPIIDRLSAAILSVGGNASGSDELQVKKNENTLMYLKMQQRILASVVPVIAQLVREGCDSGIFRTERPDEAVEMCMLYVSTVFDDDFIQDEETRTRRVAGFIYNTERLLGCRSGVLTVSLLRVLAQDNR